MWKKQSKYALIIAPLASSCAAIIAWMTLTYHISGSISITTLSGNLPLVAGNMMSLTGPILLTPLITYLKPDNYDFELLKLIKQADDKSDGAANVAEVPEAEIMEEEAQADEGLRLAQQENKTLLHARKWALIASLSMTLCFLILWPIPMYGTSYSKLYLGSGSLKQCSRRDSLFKRLLHWLDCGSLPLGFLCWNYNHAPPNLRRSQVDQALCCLPRPRQKGSQETRADVGYDPERRGGERRISYNRSCEGEILTRCCLLGCLIDKDRTIEHGTPLGLISSLAMKCDCVQSFNNFHYDTGKLSRQSKAGHFPAPSFS